MDVQQLRDDPLLARVRGLIVDEIGKRCGQIPDIHPRLLEGIESAAQIITDEIHQTGVMVTEPASEVHCSDCHHPLNRKPAFWCANAEHTGVSES